MKKLFSILSMIVALCIPIVAQTIFDGYQGVILYPIYYGNNLDRDIHSLEDIVVKEVTKAGLECYASDKMPIDFQEKFKQYPESFLFLDLDHSNKQSLGAYNSVTLIFINCNQQVVYKVTKSHAINGGLTFRGCLVNCVSMDLMDFRKNARKYVYNQVMSPKPHFPHKEITNKQARAYLDSLKTDNIEGVYKTLGSKRDNKYKIFVQRDEEFGYNVYILDEVSNAYKDVWNVGDMKAIFEPTAIKNTYSGTWINSAKSGTLDVFATYKDGVMTIQYSDDETSDNFIKLYPNLGIDSSKPIAKADGNQKPDNLKLVRSGSGFMMDNQGIIGTNNHVIADARAIKVVFTDGVEQTEYNAKLLLTDKDNDVALIQIIDTTISFKETPYSFKSNAEVGEDVFTIGFPRPNAMGENYKVTNGIISATTGVDDDVREYQITVPIQPGNSGGALFNAKGYVVGLTTSTLSEGYIQAKVENVNYAVKISYLLNLYQMLPKATTLTQSPEDIAELSEKVKKYRDFVCLIRVYQ